MYFLFFFLLTLISSERVLFSQNDLPFQRDVKGEVLIHSRLTEAQADEIIHGLSLEGIEAKKVKTINKWLKEQPDASWEIYVNPKDVAQAVAVIEQAGLPKRRKSLLFENYIRRQRELFIKDGVLEDFEDDILEEIKENPGIVDIEVLIKRLKTGEVEATVYIRHDGILDDPSSQEAQEIKMMLLDSIPGLTMDRLNFITERDRPRHYQLPNY